MTMNPPPPELLLIDDDVAMRSMLFRVITRAGYKVHEAGDGREGLKILADHPIALVLTDIIMPDVEGVELIFRIRKSHPWMPIIAMSGGGRMSPKGYLEVAKSCGANRTISKPFDIDQLLGWVADLLAEKKNPAPTAPGPSEQGGSEAGKTGSGFGQSVEQGRDGG
jgi:DNA-binding NtrC family response regulator